MIAAVAIATKARARAMKWRWRISPETMYSALDEVGDWLGVGSILCCWLDGRSLTGATLMGAVPGGKLSSIELEMRIESESRRNRFRSARISYAVFCFKKESDMSDA